MTWVGVVSDTDTCVKHQPSMPSIRNVDARFEPRPHAYKFFMFLGSTMELPT